MSDCARLPSVEVTIYLRFILTNSRQGYSSSLKRFFKFAMNFDLTLNCSGSNLNHDSIKGLIPIEFGYR